ncbi:MAG: DedA family protein, partial [Alphaproteobacteria bacterium]|nr:DedA family protein [Alphaproteobacteria bacterium]
MLSYLYSRTLALAASRHAMWTMAAISFAESSFLPLPPDFLLIPMTLAQPRR